ncbi:hypothetical protein BKA70DRAFT_1425575 [Coprinopsis sp. MPI-PUGE-AT-0042]|nr:hypothetical protein BKA70DRAFT_1425575 [Coprinopsis sp. MPI-PUGE-AT-0042]
MLLLDKPRQSRQLILFAEDQDPASQVSVFLSPRIAEGEVVLGVAHILASFNDFLAYIIDMSSHGDMTIPDGAKFNVDIDKSCP